MKRNARKLCAVVLMVSMLFSLLPGAAFAAPANENSGLKQYTSMEELIQDAIDELQAHNALVEQPEADASLVNTVEDKSGRSFDEVKSIISQGMFGHHSNGVVDTASLNLDAAEMQQVMDFLLAERHMTNAVTYQFDTANGVVSDINFTLSDGMQVGMSSLASMWQRVEHDAALQQSVSEAATEAAAVAEQPSRSLFSVSVMSDEESGEGEKNFIIPGCKEDCITHRFGQSAVTTATTIQFIWTDTPTTVTDADGNPKMKLVYDKENDAIGFAQEQTWDSELTSVEYDCPYCGAHIVIDGDEAKEHLITTDLTNYDVQTGVDEEGNPTSMTFMQYRAGVLGLPVFEDGIENYGTLAKDENGEDVHKTDMKDISSMQALYGYAEMCDLIEGKPECFGIPTAFWTSKETETTPFGAIKIALNMEADDPDVPTVYAQYIPELTQGFAALVYHYEGALLDIVADVKDLMKIADEYNLTTEYRLLLLHDWLANNAVFDMSNLLALTDENASGDVGLNSLIGMTPFTMLSTAIGYKGGVCLGYTASYAYIVQKAFPENYYADEANWEPLPVEEQNPLVDFVQIRFNVNTDEVSVAPGAFQTEGGRFNQPHFFNAVKIGNNWYYVDACYDDVNPEVISQYRVETDGNISHIYFLESPQTLAEQFEDEYDYIDSLYDGVTYVRPEDEDAYKEQVKADGKAGWPTEKAENEIAYDDTTYEEAWFTNAVSEIILQDGYWYYVEGLNAYNSMKSMDGMGDQMGDMGDLGDMMAEQQSNPKYADELKRRSVNDNNKLEGSKINMDMGGGSSMDDVLQEDKYAEGLFHYGYGYVNYGKNAVDENYTGTKAFEEDVKEDQAYRKMYPELSHGVGYYDGKLYFNLANKILCYDLADNAISQIKEYNDIYGNKKEANENEKFFAGRSFDLTKDTSADYSFRYRPIAGLSIHKEVVADRGTDEMTGGETAKSADLVSTMYIAIGTNLSESYRVNEEAYKEEAVNYNPSYQRYLDDGEDPDVNDNSEFMWCANFTEQMDMATLLDELSNGNTETVSVAAYCGKDAFTEKRTTNYGLSNGKLDGVVDGTKVVEEGTALSHKYVWNEKEQTYVCSRCNHCDADYVPTTKPGDVNGDGEVDVNDLSSLARYLGGFTDEGFNSQNADVDEKEGIDVDDLAALARILGGYEN